ncbi:phage holin family protein [Pseudonocardia bannensis]|uniref:phage holin family protein n=1 Tax=Pseudonocardia bannensis TaxID=630973 RepID=UPI0028AB122F|nr:phage holin family protein [Pseudonocardia bannensis]
MASPTSSSGTDVPPVLPSIPLSPEPTHDQSIGALVRDVTTHVSSLIRSEVELAKAEVTSEVKKGVQGSVFFVIALVVLLFSLFFFFFALAELLNYFGLARPAAFGIVFGLMVLVAALFGFLGYRRVRKIRKPERTITSLKETAEVLSSRGRHDGQEPAELNGRHAAPAS